MTPEQRIDRERDERPRRWFHTTCEILALPGIFVTIVLLGLVGEAIFGSPR